MKFDQYQALTFDCYGTLVDWETGILTALRPVLARHNVSLSDAAIIEAYSRFEARSETGTYRRYRDVLNGVVRQFGAEYGFEPTEAEANALVASFGQWKPFPDTVPALQALKRRFKLVILSNVDDDLFALTAQQLLVSFDDVITAQQIGSYKPALRNFETAIARIGPPKERILHVGASLYHDIVPAKTLGLAAVWVNRWKGKGGIGATAPTPGMPDLEVPDLKTLAALVEENLGSPN